MTTKDVVIRKLDFSHVDEGLLNAVKMIINTNKDLINNIQNNLDDMYDFVCSQEYADYSDTVQGVFLYFLWNSVNISLHDWIRYISFKNCQWITEIKIPDNVRDLDPDCFLNCQRLEKVTLPKNLDSMGIYCFYRCMELTDINLQDCEKLDVIPEGCFRECVALKHIILPEHIIEINEEAFSWGPQNRVIEVDDGVAVLDSSVFNENLNLTIKTNNNFVKEYCKNHKIKCEDR